MRSKLEKRTTVPQKYRHYRPEDWPGGWGEWAGEREAWAARQPPVLIAGAHHDGRPYSYQCGVLGDLTTLLRDRREARMIDSAQAYD